MQGQYNSVAGIKRKNKREGYHFFSIKTMRFWGSKVYGELYGGCVFVTSERTYDDTTRYNIRVGMSNGSIHSYSYGTDFGTLEDAKAIAKRLGDSISNRGQPLGTPTVASLLLSFFSVSQTYSVHLNPNRSRYFGMFRGLSFPPSVGDTKT